MGTTEIFIEHRKGEKVHKYLRVNPRSDLFVIGSSREADLRLGGEGVQGCHAVLRYRAPHWYVCDMGAEQTLLVNDELVSEAKVDHLTKVEIAGHRLQLFTKDRGAEIFSETEADGHLALHQVVVRVKGRVVASHVLNATESYVWHDGDQKHTHPCPTSGAWTRTQVGLREIQQRLVPAQELELAEGVQFDRDMKKPILLALLFLMTLVGSALLIGRGVDTKSEVTLDQKSMDIIFNAKTIKKKRLESEKIQKVAKAKAGGTNDATAANNATSKMPEESTAPKVTSKTSAALTSLRQSGLGNLIGKIAKRANKQGIMVAAVGVAPDVQGAGRALFSAGTTLNAGGGSASKEGPAYRLGGIATRGKAGGASGFKDGTALAGGAVGSGNVMALSDDEETAIEGGLDKDVIADVIKRNLGQIRYCYERQLSSNPDLYGKVLVKFTISASGEVGEQRVDGSTLKSAMVEGCILRRMAGWKFPLPKGGTQVRVSYPFLFKALE